MNTATDVTLYFSEGVSDKQYRVWVQPAGGAFHVMAAWGRRGGHQTVAAKTPEPVSSGKAADLLAKLISDKAAKGYKPATAPSTPPPVVLEAGAATKFLEPMLLNPIDEATGLRLIVSDDWVAQMKHNGIRAQLQRIGSEFAAFSRTGKAIALPANLLQALRKVAPDYEAIVLDGELVDGLFFCFDIIHLDVIASTPSAEFHRTPYDVRLGYLEQLVPEDGPLSRVLTARTSEEKSAMLQTLKAHGAEGIVFKHVDGNYRAGRPNSGGDVLKWKFVAMASVIVAKEPTGKRSVNMQLADRTRVGSVTIPPNAQVPPVGSIIEVEYLYAHRGGCLVQAVYLGVREDILPSECTVGQLQFKNEGKATA